LIAGFVLGLLLAPAFERSARSPMLPAAAAMSLLGVGLICGVAVYMGRSTDNYRLAALLEDLDMQAKDLDSRCQSAGKMARVDPSAARSAYDDACVRSLTTIEARLTELDPADAAMRQVIAEQRADVTRRRARNLSMLHLIEDVAALKPADDARAAAVEACKGALLALDRSGAAKVRRMLRDDCLVPLDRAITLLDAAKATSSDMLRSQHASRQKWRAERAALERVERALARNDANALDAAILALDAVWYPGQRNDAPAKR
jgi:hypothetical protein